MAADQSRPIRICLGGDVMTGRGVDQVLPHPGDPTLYEAWVRDAREYVRLAEAAHGSIPAPVSLDYIWGDALEDLRSADVRVVNLETAITTSPDYWPGKGINYRMHPGNVGCLTAAGLDCCGLANNHVLDWGYEGLAETLRTLTAAGIPHPGAGHDATEAAAPAILAVPGRGRVLVFALGSTTSGIPREWAAAEGRPGVQLLEDLSEGTARRVAERVRGCKQPGDSAVVSIHWGGNWGDHVSGPEIEFAHRLIDGGVDIVHGHSSHHVKPVEVYRDRLILYGCGDLLNDYEGIPGHEWFRGDLALLYLVDLDPQSSRLLRAQLVPFQIRRFRLNRPSEADRKWVGDRLNLYGEGFGTFVEQDLTGTLLLRGWS